MPPASCQAGELDIGGLALDDADVLAHASDSDASGSVARLHLLVENAHAVDLLIGERLVEVRETTLDVDAEIDGHRLAHLELLVTGAEEVHVHEVARVALLFRVVLELTNLLVTNPRRS